MTMAAQPAGSTTADGTPVARYAPGRDRLGDAVAHCLEAAGIAGASTVIVGTDEDSRNMLTARKVRTHFDVPRVPVLVHDSDRCDRFGDTAHEPICVSTTFSNALVDQDSTTSTRPEVTA